MSYTSDTWTNSVICTWSVTTLLRPLTHWCSMQSYSGYIRSPLVTVCIRKCNTVFLDWVWRSFCDMLHFKPDRQWRSSSFQESKKVHISRDLWPWPWHWAHPGCMLTWSPSCASLVAIRPFVCEKKRFAQKFTDRQTDGQTTDAAPLH